MRDVQCHPQTRPSPNQTQIPTCCDHKIVQTITIVGLLKDNPKSPVGALLEPNTNTIPICGKPKSGNRPTHFHVFLFFAVAYDMVLTFVVYFGWFFVLPAGCVWVVLTAAH